MYRANLHVPSRDSTFSDAVGSSTLALGNRMWGDHVEGEEGRGKDGDRVGATGGTCDWWLMMLTWYHVVWESVASSKSEILVTRRESSHGYSN